MRFALTFLGERYSDHNPCGLCVLRVPSAVRTFSRSKSPQHIELADVILVCPIEKVLYHLRRRRMQGAIEQHKLPKVGNNRKVNLVRKGKVLGRVTVGIGLVQNGGQM